MRLFERRGADAEGLRRRQVLYGQRAGRSPRSAQGIKDYANWPTIPQLYVNGEFVGGCDIMREMYESGELQQLLAQASRLSGTIPRSNDGGDTPPFSLPSGPCAVDALHFSGMRAQRAHDVRQMPGGRAPAR